MSRFQLADDGEDEDVEDAEDVEAEDAAEEPLSAQPMPMREAVLRDILTTGFASSDTKLVPNALTLSSVYVRAFVEEARHRAEAVALEEGAASVADEHVEKILPALLLDMGP